MKSADSCFPKRRALTLIEVVAGLALMSLVLVTSLVGIRRHEKQADTAELKQLAVSLADRLLTTWYETEGIVAASQTGTVLEMGTPFQWQTQAVYVPQLRSHKVRLTVRRSDIDRPLVSVEVLATPAQSIEAMP